MPPNNLCYLADSRRRPCSTFLAAIAAIQCSHVVFAHTLLMTPGQVVLQEGRASVELDVAMEDFMHWYGLNADANGLVSKSALLSMLERHALALHRIFTIRDVTGAHLPSEPFRFDLDWPAEDFITLGTIRSHRAKFTTTFSYPDTPQFLTFQLLMGPDNPSLNWQTVLNVHGVADDGALVCLTSLGNAESIELRWSGSHVGLAAAAQAEGVCPQGVAGLKQICAMIDIETDSIEAKVSIPLALLQTWLPLESDDEFLTSDQQKSLQNRIETVLAGALSVQSKEIAYAGEIEEVVFLPLDSDRPDPTRDSRPISLVSGRVSVRLRYRTPPALEQVDFQWNLLNNQVLSAAAWITGSGPPTQHEFSSYRPEYHWQRRP